MGRIRRRFLTTELCLYVGFLLADARCLYGLGTALKYAGILLCVAYAFSNGGSGLIPVGIELLVGAWRYAVHCRASPLCNPHCPGHPADV